MAHTRKASKVKRRAGRTTPPAPVAVPIGDVEGPPPINGELLRSKAILELLVLITKSLPDVWGKPRTSSENPQPFLLPPHALATVIPDDDDPTDDLAPEAAEYGFARCLMHFGSYGVAAGLGLEWNYVLAGLVRLAMGARLPTIEEITALRGKAAVAAGR